VTPRGSRCFQLDLYETWAIDQDRRIDQDEASIELRYALADWGKIPLSPTLYLEYAEHSRDPNTLEGKLLFGEDLSRRWHWGLNLACEQELSGTSNTELAATKRTNTTPQPPFAVNSRVAGGCPWRRPSDSVRFAR